MTLNKKTVSVDIEVNELTRPGWVQEMVTELLQTPDLSTQQMLDLACLLRMATGAAGTL